MTILSTPACPRALWRVIALTVATFGLYSFVWAGLSWFEMKRELKDEGMSPFWHALSMSVPIYGLFRLHNHYRTINSLFGGPEKVNPGGVVKAVLIASIASNIAGRISPGFGVVMAVVFLITVAWALAHGQAALNAYWAKRQ